MYPGLKRFARTRRSSTCLQLNSVHGKSQMKVYFYKPTDKFFKGDVAKVDTAFKKLPEPWWVQSVSTELNARVEVRTP